MHKLVLLFSLTMIFNNLFAQNTYILNNTQGTPANYRTLQGALDSVPAGSIILMQGSGINYGLATVSKPVVIYGPGYFLGQNNSPYTQANLNEAMLIQLVFTSGSQGSIISGLSFEPRSQDDYNSNNRININATFNISINRCRIESNPANGGEHQSIAIINSTNVTISQCYIDLNAAVLCYFNNASGVLFKNNIIEGQPYLYIGSNFSSPPYSYSFQNNSMRGTIDDGSRFCNGNFINNVMINTGTGTTYTGCGMASADHNVSNINIFPGGTNITNADGANTYVLYTNPAISSNDGIYQLKLGSVAIGYGNDGTDAGAYGTPNTKYVFSGIPAIPNIYFADVPQNGTTTGGLKVHLKIKANN
ncbi:MAG TPA: hypothetical protein VIM07_10450 [Chitinophagaceae bacterium]